MTGLSSYHVLGLVPDTPVGPWVRWGHELLRRLPGSRWVLEQGEWQGGAFLRSYAPPEVHHELARLALLRGDLRLEPRPWDPGDETPPTALGVLRFLGPWETPYPDPDPPELPARLGTPWAVQGVLMGGDPPEGQVRIASWGPPPGSLNTRQCLLLSWGRALGGVPEAWVPASRGHRIAEREWRHRELERFHGGPAPGMPADRWSHPWRAPVAARDPFGPSRAAANASPLPWARGWGDGNGWSPGPATLLRHVLVLGLTGSGKTQLLAHGAAQVHRQGVPLVALDLHGDLTPAILDRLPDPAPGEFLLIGPGPGESGMDVLALPADKGGPGLGPRRVGELLGALRPAGALKDEFWGPRMERLLEGGLRCVLGTGGSLYDLARLFQDPFGQAGSLRPLLVDPTLREFLDELVSVHHRQPDFLASVQNRLSRVLFDPAIRGLVAPPTGGVDPERALVERRSILLHLPKGELGEGGGLFVAHLLLARCYLALLRGEHPGPDRLRSLFILDESHLLSPRLLGTMVREGRKFGVGLLLATQGAGDGPHGVEGGPWSEVGTVVGLRMAPGPARQVLPWLAPRLPLHAGSRPAAEFVGALARLPRHTAYLREVGEDVPRLVVLPGPTPPSPARGARRSPVPPPGPSPSPAGPRPPEPEAEEIDGLLGILAGRPPPDPRPAWWRQGERRGFLEALPTGGFGLTEAGWGRLGWRGNTGAPRESFEHLRLLRDAFTLLAYRGLALEMPRQGGFERRLPDARWRRRAGGAPRSTPGDGRALAGPLDGAQELHLEVEVSSLEDPRRLARSWEKAQEQGAHLLWVAGTSGGGERLRAFLRKRGAGRREATVWVLREQALRKWRGSHPGPGAGK
jgi:hypothetical protein